MAFRRYLQETALYPGLDTIECHLIPNGLWLLAQHPAPEVLPPHSLLRNLEEAFREIMAEVCLPALLDYGDPLLVKLQLKTLQGHKPYATHTFLWHFQEAAAVVFDLASADQPTKAEEQAEERAAVPTLVADQEPESNPSLDAPSPSPPLNPPPKDGSRILRYGVYGLAASIVLGSCLFAYGITRPCVVGACDRIPQAEEFKVSAQERLANDPTPADVLAAQEELQIAVKILNGIPLWSSHHAAITPTKQNYQRDLDAVTQLINAQRKATEAVQDSQNPPYPLEHWEQIQRRWRQAIALLEDIPPGSLAAPLAQEKLQEYQANDQSIGQRIDNEAAANKHYSQATSTAQMAQQRSETADSLASWRLAEREWTIAIQELSLILQGTATYPKAQQQLPAYQQQLNQAKSRVRIETMANRAHEQAKAAAAQAEAAIEQNQWTLAVSHWRDALARAQSVPQNTSLTATAEALVDQYEAALTQSQKQLQTAVALNQMQATLNELCSGSGPCSVTAETGQVQITLNGQFANALETAITPPGNLDGEITPAAQQLIEAIMALGNRLESSLDIYDSGNRLIARYRPDLGGFIRD